MAPKYDKYGLNRQYKKNPCSGRDPFPRDHLPFVDDMSNKKVLDDAVKQEKKASAKNRLKRTREETEKIQQSIREATKKMRKVASESANKFKKGVANAAHSKFEQYAMEAAGFGLDFLAAAVLFGSEGAAAPLAGVIAEEGIELQSVAAADMVGEYVAEEEAAAATERSSLLRQRPRTRSGRRYGL